MVTFFPGPLRGEVGVPGDKSISHRALLAGACCSEPLVVGNLNPGRDVNATLAALVALGIRVESANDRVTIHPGRLVSPAETIDCMNSGSTARMLLGACAGAGVSARFDGDSSLRGRPMEPVAAQLRAFGARIETTDGHLPLRLSGTPRVETRRFILLAPSAQVKSALLFAGLYAGVSVTVDGDRGSRDHTERLLAGLGCAIEWDGRSVSLGTSVPGGGRIDVPGDLSSASFFVTAAAITCGSSVVVRDVGVNPTRTGLLDALQRMGAAIVLRNPRNLCGEPVADLEVSWAALRPAAIGPDVALRAIDEIPLIAVAAAFAQGTTSITGIEALRSKESDRVAAIERLLRSVNVGLRQIPGGIAIDGGLPQPTGEIVATHDDHRIVMVAAVLAAAAGPVAVDHAESVDVSFPGFIESLERLRSGP